MSPCNKSRSSASSSAAPVRRASGVSIGGGASSSSRPAAAARRSPPPPNKPWRRTSFPCVACGKAFPTQQAMARHDGSPGELPPAAAAGHVVVQPAPRRGRPRSWPGAAPAANQQLVRYFPPPFVPMSSSNQQVARGGAVGQLRPPGPNNILLHGPAAMAARAAVRRHLQGLQAAVWLGLGPFLPHQLLLPLPAVPPFNTTTAPVPAAAPGQLTQQQASPAMMVPPQLRVDLTLRLGSGGGGNLAQMKASTVLSLGPVVQDGGEGNVAALSLGPPVVEDGGEGNMAAAMDGGDQGGQVGKDMDGIDLELRLRR